MIHKYYYKTFQFIWHNHPY